MPAKYRHALFALFLASGVLALGAGAQAQTEAANQQTAAQSESWKSDELGVCNRTGFVMDLAVGIQNQEVRASQGWYRSYPGFCTTFELNGAGEGVQRHLFVRAAPIYPRQPIKYHGDQKFCVVARELRQSFFLRDASECAKQQGTMERFFSVHNVAGVSPNAPIELADGDRHSLRRAKFKGLQQLLLLAGYYRRQVDGLAGRATLAATREFAADSGISLTSPYDPPISLFTGLVEQIAQLQANDGMRMCNDTTAPIWLALGLASGEGLQSRGWYQLEPASCSQVVNDLSGVDKIFAYAETRNTAVAAAHEDARKRSWSGDVNICTKSIKFVLSAGEDCSVLGRAMIGFREIPLGGARPISYSFGARNADSSANNAAQ